MVSQSQHVDNQNVTSLQASKGKRIPTAERDQVHIQQVIGLLTQLLKQTLFGGLVFCSNEILNIMNICQQNICSNFPTVFIVYFVMLFFSK
jgi:hypothetical protein